MGPKLQSFDDAVVETYASDNRATTVSGVTIVCCPDKFRGSMTAAEAARALADGVRRKGFAAVELPLADGGEGTLDVLCPNPSRRRRTTVRGPLGVRVDAEWGLRTDGTAVVESAQASGLALVAGSPDPIAASTYGTGELIRAAIGAGASRIIVGVGGSATVDGGLGALTALDGDLRGVDVVVACDVQTTFVDAARLFGPQKGATPDDVVILEERLLRLAQRYRDDHDVDLPSLAGSGAAGGLAGGLAAIGATLVPGAELVAEVAQLEGALDGARAAITGEGRLDRTSFEGKVVAHVLARGKSLGVPVGVVSGDAEVGAGEGIALLTLVQIAGSTDAAYANAGELTTRAASMLVTRILR